TNINIKDFCLDGNRIWVLGSESNNEVSYNLYAFDLNNRKYFHKISGENGLTEEPSQIFLDHEYNLWVISNNGVFLLKGNAFTAFSVADGLVGNKVWGLNKSNDGILWVGTIGEGMSVIKNGKTYNYTKANGLPDNYVGKIYQTKQGDVLIGTSNAGLSKVSYGQNLSKIRFERLPFLDGIRFRIDDVLEDKNGTLWVASSKGLYYSKDMLKYIHKPLSSSDTGDIFIQKLLLDSIKNELWIATRFNGVYVLDDSTVRRFTPIDSTEEISSLVMDYQRNVWIGTRNKGVFRWDYSAIRQFSEKDGLVSNLTYILYPDSRNNLWIGSNLGLDRIDLEALSRNEKNYIRHYGSDEGLVDLETNLNGVISDEFGFLLSTNGGLLKYEQDADKLNSVPPKVRITGLKLRSQETNWSQYSSDVDAWNGLPNKLKLKYDQNHLTFEFVGVSFRNPRMVQYSWKLDGFDDKWITGKSRQAIYSNLPPGKYIFRLKAANSDLFWSDEVKSMPFVILPPFWATWWFRIVSVLLIAFAIYMYVLTRIRGLKEKQKELESLVSIRTAELREQFRIVDEKNKQILDSLKYAKFLQSAILRSVDDIKGNFADAFVFYKPKDFVSGDFYWFSRYNNISVFAVADCTGHGVPGAIISVICESSLRQAVLGCMYENPAKILEYTNKYVIDTFSQTNKDIHDGMEIALCTFNHQTNELTYCGAKLGVYLFANNNFIKLKPSIQRIGWDRSTIKFENQTLVLETGSMIYMFTDGFGDQFDYKSKEKFSSVRLRKLLEANANFSAEEQHNILEKEFNCWKGDNEQIDDILVLGIKF
ncbi:MAG: SpoIIE family protein phosphatase, partial [Bacteroidales bacterium]